MPAGDAHRTRAYSYPLAARVQRLEGIGPRGGADVGSGEARTHWTDVLGIAELDAVVEIEVGHVLEADAGFLVEEE